MDIFLYIIIFIMGTLFGSFYTLAIYRIPNKIDITHTHSFCPNCHHKLGFFELIPVWSYIFLGGKCKECQQKIRPRYIIIEVLSGITLVLIAYALKINIESITLIKLIDIAFLVLYLSGIAIIAGIDFENNKIEKSVIYYAIGILIFYIIYLCIVDTANIYRYIMYLSLILVLLIADTMSLKKKAKTSYVLSISILLLVMAVFTGEVVTIYTLITTLLAVFFYAILKIIIAKRSKNRSSEKKKIENIKFGFYISITNVIMLIIMLFLIR